MQWNLWSKSSGYFLWEGVNMKNLYILGAGGFGHVIKDMAEQSGKYTKICFLDDN